MIRTATMAPDPKILFCQTYLRTFACWSILKAASLCEAVPICDKHELEAKALGFSHPQESHNPEAQSLRTNGQGGLGKP